jgi:nucleoside-diphosphate-sugar epimerase
MSSLAALGPCRNGEALTEDSVPHPLSCYGQSKLAAEVVLHAAARRVPSVILRFSSIYGPRERAVLRFFQMVRRGVAVTVGAWSREVSLIYSADALNALIAAGTSPRAPGRTYCVAHPESVTWEAFAHTVGLALRREPLLLSIVPGAARVVALAIEESARLRGRAAVLNRERVREVSQARWVCDPSPAIEEIGFRPSYPISEGARETADWYEKAGWL